MFDLRFLKILRSKRSSEKGIRYTGDITVVARRVISGLDLYDALTMLLSWYPTTDGCR